MIDPKKEKKWLEDLRNRTKKLRERAAEKPEPKNLDVGPKKSTIQEEYIEINEGESEVEEKPEVAVKIEKENHYAVIKPIIDEIKEKTKEELQEEKIKKGFHEEKIKEVKPVSVKKTEKTDVPKEKFETTNIDIETTIDKLIDIINKRGIVTTLELSKELSVTIERIESWAKILEDRGLIDIEYPLIGTSKLRKKEWKKEP